MRVGIRFAAPMLFACRAYAQTTGACGLSEMREGVALTYPAIARAAHVHGYVVMLVRFAQNGTVLASRTLYGPQMLRYTAEPFVRGLRANTYSGPRECPIVVEYVNGPEVEKPRRSIERLGLQHIRITAENAIPVTMYSIAAK